MSPRRSGRSCARPCCLRRPDAARRSRRKRRPSLTADADDEGALPEAAIRLLARREHGAHELADKLVRRGHGPEAVAAELERLAASGLQSDARFAEAFAEQRVERGDGPVKIRAALAERRIAAERIEEALAPFEGEWPKRAAAALRKRFGAAPAGTWDERARRARFLQQRGFPAEIVRRATDFDASDD